MSISRAEAIQQIHSCMREAVLQEEHPTMRENLEDYCHLFHSSSMVRVPNRSEALSSTDLETLRILCDHPLVAIRNISSLPGIEVSQIRPFIESLLRFRAACFQVLESLEQEIVL